MDFDRLKASPAYCLSFEVRLGQQSAGSDCFIRCSYCWRLRTYSPRRSLSTESAPKSSVNEHCSGFCAFRADPNAVFFDCGLVMRSQYRMSSCRSLHHSYLAQKLFGISPKMVSYSPCSQGAFSSCPINVSNRPTFYY